MYAHAALGAHGSCTLRLQSTFATVSKISTSDTMAPADNNLGMHPTPLLVTYFIADSKYRPIPSPSQLSIYHPLVMREMAAPSGCIGYHLHGELIFPHACYPRCLHRCAQHPTGTNHWENLGKPTKGPKYSAPPSKRGYDMRISLGP